jgi:hypothetical protein
MRSGGGQAVKVELKMEELITFSAVGEVRKIPDKEE